MIYNRASYELPLFNAVPSNVVGMALFMIMAAGLLCLHVRHNVVVWAEATGVTAKSDCSKLRCVAVGG